jgi:hypothetical protein
MPTIPLAVLLAPPWTPPKMQRTKLNMPWELPAGKDRLYFLVHVLLSSLLLLSLLLPLLVALLDPTQQILF